MGRIATIMFILILLGVPVRQALAANAGIRVGYGQSFRSYEADNDTGTRSSADRIDELFGAAQYNHEFFGGRLGTLRFDSDFADRYLNYYPNSGTSLAIPYSEGAGADQEEHFFYNYKGNVDIKLPRQKFRLRYQNDASKVLSPDEEVFFNSLNRITNNYEPLRAVNRSLSEYRWQRLESSRLHYYGGTVGLMTDALTVDIYDYGTTGDYLTDRDRWRSGFTIRPLHIGVLGENERERFSEHLGDRTDRFVRTGFLNEFGYDDPVHFGSFSLAGYTEDGDITYRGVEHENNLATASLTYDDRPWKVVNRIDTAETEDIYTGDGSDRRSWSGSLEWASHAAKFQLRGFAETDTRSVNDTRISSLDLAGINDALIGTGIIGPGTIELAALSTTVIVHLDDLIVDGDPWSGPSPVIIDPGEAYVISFDTDISANTGITLDDPLMEDDFVAAINRSLVAEYDRETRRAEMRHRWRGGAGLASNFRASFETVDLESVAIERGTFTLPESTRNIRAAEALEIRPRGLIFDVSADYARTETGDDWYEKLAGTFKDGLYTPSRRLYLTSFHSTTTGNGYDDVSDTRFTLVYERIEPMNTLRLLPEWRKETVEDDYTRINRILDARLEKGSHGFSAYLKRETETGEVSDYTIKRVQDRAEYRYTTRPNILKLTYRHYDDAFALTSYSASLTSRRFRVYPADETYITNELNIYRDVLYPGEENERVEDFIVEKVTYTPTRRLMVIVALEMQIEEENEALDIEYGIEYTTRSFKVATGYRTTRTERDGEITDEAIYYVEIRRSVGVGSFVSYDR